MKNYRDLGISIILHTIRKPNSIIALLVRSLSAKYRPDRYRRDKSVKFVTELP